MSSGPSTAPGGCFLPAGARCHLAGVAGVGMSALAQALAARGFRVSGSDRYLDQGRELEVLRKLRHGGVDLYPQDGSGVRAGARAMVVSTAVEKDNPDVRAAAEGGIPILHRSEILAALADGLSSVAIAGTSGKTTTTGLVGWLWEQLGVDPTVVNGGAVVNWAGPDRVGNFRAGASDVFIFEADESDRSFLRYRPDWAVITNISHDHFPLEETIPLFADFASRVTAGLVAGPQAAEILRGHGVEGPALWSPADESPFEAAATDGGSRFRYRGDWFDVPLPGLHNAENAWLAIALADRCGLDWRAAGTALRGFRGIERRLEYVGGGRGIRVYDEYAHNPAKIAAAWRAVAPVCGRVRAVWRPHGFGPLAQMFDSLVESFRDVCRPGDRLFLLPVYYAGGTTSAKTTSDDLVAALVRAGVSAALAPDYAELERLMLDGAREGDAMLVMGARDPDLPLFARQLAARLAKRN